MAQYTPEQIQQAIENARAAGDENAVRSLSGDLARAMQTQAEIAGRGPMREVAQSALFGLGEEIESKMTGQPVGEIRQEIEQYRRQAPVASLAFEVAGGLAPGLGLGAALPRMGATGRALAQEKYSFLKIFASTRKKLLVIRSLPIN